MPCPRSAMHAIKKLITCVRGREVSSGTPGLWHGGIGVDRGRPQPGCRHTLCVPSMQSVGSSFRRLLAPRLPHRASVASMAVPRVKVMQAPQVKELLQRLEQRPGMTC